MIPDIVALRRIAGVLIPAALCIALSPDAAAARDPAPDQPRVPAPVAAARHEATPSLEWVNPYIGTGSGGGGSDYGGTMPFVTRSEEHTSELQSRVDLVCRLLL